MDGSKSWLERRKKKLKKKDLSNVCAIGAVACGASQISKWKVTSEGGFCSFKVW